MQFLLNLTDKSCACRGDFTRLYSFFLRMLTGKRQFCTKWGHPGGSSSQLEYLWGSKRCSIVAQIDICSCYSFWKLPSVSFDWHFHPWPVRQVMLQKWSPFPPHFFTESLDAKSSRPQISWILFCQNVSRLGFHQHDLLQTVWNFCSVHAVGPKHPVFFLTACNGEQVISTPQGNS